MGEGWSDYWAITINGDGLVGEYSTGNTTAGIRRAAYTVPANTIHDSYADVGNQGFSVHNDGEIWAATLWDLRTGQGLRVVRGDETEYASDHYPVVAAKHFAAPGAGQVRTRSAAFWKRS